MVPVTPWNKLVLDAEEVAEITRLLKDSGFSYFVFEEYEPANIFTGPELKEQKNSDDWDSVRFPKIKTIHCVPIAHEQIVVGRNLHYVS